MNFRRTLFVLTAVTALPAFSSAQSGGFKVAKYAGEFLAIGVGSRALGLGGAYAALANDVTAGYWNPAGLARLNYPQITLMHHEGFGGLVNYDYGAVALPVGGRSSLAFSAIRMGVDDIPRTSYTDLNGDGLPDETEIRNDGYFNSADWALLFSYAKRSSDRFSYGANIKIIRRELGDASATGVGFDLGAQYLATDRLSFGVNVQDITTTLVAWSTGTNELISPTLKLGSAWSVDALGGRFTPAADADLRFENRLSASNSHLGPVSADFHGGLEYGYRDLFALRTGFSDIGSLTVGTGIHLPKLDIDYSFAKFDAEDQLGNTHRLSITFTLQAEQFARSGE